MPCSNRAHHVQIPAAHADHSSPKRFGNLQRPNCNLLLELRIDSPGRRPGEIVHLLLDIRLRRSEGVAPSPGLPDDFAQHVKQGVNILLVVLDAQAHSGEAR